MKKKIAVISGGSSGIGKAIVDSLSSENYVVVNADIHISENSSSVDNFKCDITKPEEVEALHAHVKEKYGIPDVLISNAGQGIHEKLSEGDPEKWKEVLDINVMGALRLIRAFTPEMISKRSGTVFFTSSVAAKQNFEYGGVYSASKAALSSIANTLRLEVADILRVFILSPGVVNTDFFKNMISSSHTVEDIGWGSLSAEEVANVLVYLLKLPPSISIPEVVLTPPKQIL